MIWRLSFLTVSVVGFLFAQSCASGVNVKVYHSDPSQGGMVRAQAKELIHYQDTQNWKCLNEDDARRLFEDYLTCKKLCKK